MNQENPYAGVETILTDIFALSQQRRAVFNSADYYWHKRLQKLNITDTSYKVANLGAGLGIDAIPLSFALTGKTQYDLKLAARERPKTLPIQIINYDISTERIHTALNHPLINRYAAPSDSYVNADMKHLPEKDGSVSMCYVRNPAWQHIIKQTNDERGKKQDPKSIMQVFTEIDRVLTPNEGLLWMTFLFENEYQTAIAALQINTLQEKYAIRVAERNRFPGQGIIFQDSITGNNETHYFDTYILIAEKTGI